MLESVKTFEELALKKGKKRIAIPAAQDDLTLPAVKRVIDENLGEPIFIGIKDEIIKICKNIGLDYSKYRFIEESDYTKCAEIAVKLIKAGEADVLMRGILDSTYYLKAMLNKENGIKNAPLISQMGFLDMKSYHKVFAYTDSGINIAPTLEQKKLMIENAVEVLHKLGIAMPKVAAISAIEKVNEKIPSSVDAAKLKEMNQRGEITGCVIDGPLAMDLAISKQSCEHKGLKNPAVCGDADLVLLPDIVSANVFYKTTTFLAGAIGASIICGTSAPVAFPSRSDSIDTKYYSLVCAIALT